MILLLGGAHYSKSGVFEGASHDHFWLNNSTRHGIHRHLFYVSRLVISVGAVVPEGIKPSRTLEKQLHGANVYLSQENTIEITPIYYRLGITSRNYPTETQTLPLGCAESMQTISESSVLLRGTWLSGVGITVEFGDNESLATMAYDTWFDYVSRRIRRYVGEYRPGHGRVNEIQVQEEYFYI